LSIIQRLDTEHSPNITRHVGLRPPKRLLETKRLSVSFSGGETSGYMLWWCMTHLRQTIPNLEIIVTFSNTGLEDERTLKFVDMCDKQFSANVVWLEAVVNPQRGIGIRHKVVTFETASRAGEPFERMIEKYGIPSPGTPFCSSRLKEEVMHSYRRSLGWSDDSFVTAIGIRADEIDRISETVDERGLWYPLVGLNVKKSDVKTFWSKQIFCLVLPEHYGNCVTCWKKSFRKLYTLALDDPKAFDFMDRMEKTHGKHKPRTRPGANQFFREYKTVQDIFYEAKAINFKKFIPGAFQLELFDPHLDTQGACGDSCEVGADQ
jgi:3'-phosphoadenosine 5'-phosphosulfate sulfotransferase (PAPS reductase)/FAD synthetase